MIKMEITDIHDVCDKECKHNLCLHSSYIFLLPLIYVYMKRDELSKTVIYVYTAVLFLLTLASAVNHFYYSENTLWRSFDVIIAYGLVATNAIFIFNKCYLKHNETILSIVLALLGGVLFYSSDNMNRYTNEYQIIHSLFHIIASVGTLFVVIAINKCQNTF